MHDVSSISSRYLNLEKANKGFASSMPRMFALFRFPQRPRGPVLGICALPLLWLFLKFFAFGNRFPGFRIGFPHFNECVLFWRLLNRAQFARFWISLSFIHFLVAHSLSSGLYRRQRGPLFARRSG